MVTCPTAQYFLTLNSTLIWYFYFTFTFRYEQEIPEQKTNTVVCKFKV